MENPLLVFISSVINIELEDLAAERLVARDAVEGLRLTRPWLFEHGPASADLLERSYLRKVEECEIFLLILGRALTDPVQEEFRVAVAKSKARLVFVKADRATRGSRSAEAIEFISRIDTRYKLFTSTDELRREILEAVSDELILGYRRYRLAGEDFDTLFQFSTRGPLGLALRPLEAAETDTIRGILREMGDWYPDIHIWEERKLGDELRRRQAFVTVADIGGSVAGIAISSEKGANTRKLSTLYVREPFRGASVGSHLVYGEVLRAWRDGIRKIQVTFADERRRDVEPLLSRYGFLFEGISPSRYRQDSSEVVMGKALHSASVGPSDFVDFVRRHLFECRGYRIRVVDDKSFVAEWGVDVIGRAWPLVHAGSYLVYASTSSDPESQMERAQQAASAAGEPLVFLSMYGFREPPQAPLLLDGYDLQLLFFPLELACPESKAQICPIRERYADQLMPSGEQRRLFPPTQLQIRTDNVYYRRADRFQALRRGMPLLFYVSRKPPYKSGLIGEARVAEWRVDDPMALFSRYGSLGIYRFSDIETTARSRGGQALAIKFEWFREYEHPLTIDEIKSIVPLFNPVTAWDVDYETLKRIRSAAGWK